MKNFLFALVALALVGSVAWASVPDEGMSEVLPQDNHAYPRGVGVPDPAERTAAANIEIWVRAENGDAIPNSFVEIFLNGNCITYCLCPDLDLNGYTDDNGYIMFNVKVGGCCQEVSSMIITADSTPLRHYDIFVSPDWNGGTGSCEVTLADFIAFSAAWGTSGLFPCEDFTGDNGTFLGDFIIFADAWGKDCDGAGIN